MRAKIAIAGAACWLPLLLAVPTRLQASHGDVGSTLEPEMLAGKQDWFAQALVRRQEAEREPSACCALFPSNRTIPQASRGTGGQAGSGTDAAEAGDPTTAASQPSTTTQTTTATTSVSPPSEPASPEPSDETTFTTPSPSTTTPAPVSSTEDTTSQETPTCLWLPSSALQLSPASLIYR
jgi:hypothetical protein